MNDAAELKRGLDEFLAAYRHALLDGPGSGDEAIEAERRVISDLLDASSDSEFVFEAPLHKPVCRFLEAAHEPQGHPIMDALLGACLPLAEAAVWRNKYRDQPDRQTLFNNFAFCDFVGPDGWLRASDVTLGLTMLGPDIHYPSHRHPARELYLLLSGSSDWATESEVTVRHEPGDWLLHTEMQPHAIISREKPMLAVSAWRGDILNRSRFIPKS